MLDTRFQAPRFDAGGKKTAKAHFHKVILNGQVMLLRHNREFFPILRARFPRPSRLEK
jgi:hypothetical protein